MKEQFKFKVKNGDKVEEFSLLERSKAVASEAELVYGAVYAACVRRKLLTNAEALRIANEKGGVLNEEEMEDYKKASEALAEKLKNDKKEGDEGYKEHKSALDAVRQKLTNYNMKIEDTFQFTAETIARDASILHYALALTYKDGKPFFAGKDYDSRKKAYEESNDLFVTDVLRHANWYSTLITLGVSDLEANSFPEKV